YAFNHNIQQLNVAFLFDKDDVEFPLCLSSCPSLKHLSVTRERFSFMRYNLSRTDESFRFSPYHWRHSISYVFKATSIWELPALTTLYLHDATLCCDENTDECIGPFSKCANLKSLTLKDCYIKGFMELSICLPLLSNLTLENFDGNLKIFDIVAPQLKNLTIKGSFMQAYEYMISAPDLAFLLYKSYDRLQLYTDGFPFLEKADISVYRPQNVHQVLYLLPQLHNVKSLTLNLEIVELLSSFVELMSLQLQPSPFANLKSLKIYPEREEVPEHESVTMSAEVKSYLLDSSLGATFTLVTREDVRVARTTKLAQNRIAALRAQLEQEKTRTDTKMTKIHEQGRPQFSEHSDTYIDMCWKDSSVQIEKGKEKAADIITELQEIKELLTQLPASNLPTIQSSFSTLCAEANIVTNKIIE
ncbi:hypothetical protein M8C21_024280, partial [Ambrosia artemisiifolia]